MKTILYNPIFINPQAYYVFPRLTRYLQPDNESTAEPANYIGTIEVKVIAYGDTTLKRTYTNTDSIDLSEFKNTWIRISLFTKVGSCVLGEWKIGNMESDLPYIDPEVLASLKAVVIVGNKTNNDSDRAVVKNLVDPDNPFVISNAAYTEGSGYADKDSPYYGAFVTDGIDDMITSTKTVQEMLGGSNEITVVSMVHQIDGNVNYTNGYTNYIRHGGGYIRNSVTGIDGKGLNKTGIYGYTATNLNSSSENLGNVINNILGDKKDYTFERNSTYTLDDAKYSVQNFINANNQPSNEGSSVAWYWTVIANKVLTTDQINQVIAYFNLDRTLKPDIYCNIAKQGITNENHAEFGDRLIDFSGNGRDIQLNNIAWKLDSGIGKYETDLSDTRIWTRSKEITSSPFSFSYNGLSGWILFANTELTNSTDIPSFKIQIKGLLEGQELIYRYYDSNGQSNVYSMGKDGEYTLPSDVRTAKTQTSNTSGFQVVKNEANIITITQIPSHAGALCLDGVNDFGQFVGDLGLKDYTLIMNRAYNNLINNQVPLVSSNIVEDQTPFIVEHWNTGSNAISFSYGASRTTDIPLDINKKIVYQSTYSYMGYVIPKGNAISTGNGITLGKFGNGVQYSAICLWSLMLFPYSMSKFLIERQLKKHKLGTLYPDMVEFRPVIKTNVDYTVIQFYINKYTKRIYPGDYIPINTPMEVNFYLKNNVDELISFKVNGNDSTFKKSTVVDNAYNIRTLPITKSPQKINITIDEYIRYEDIVQPYPSLFTLIDYDTEEVYSWGSKLKVGARFKGNVVNLLPNMYEWQGNVLYNGEVLDWGIKPGVVAKEMVFSWNMPFKYLIDNNEPKVILSPRLLRIPNSSYKILGYIPDISGHGNHGKINNSAYAEGSGVNEDGSYQFDGVDDFVTIPTLSSGGKQVLMKVNSRKSDCYLYDQRNNWTQYLGIVSTKDFIAYNYSNQRGKTYIDGILNENITANDLIGITHNITVTNNRDDVKQYSPCIGTSFARNSYAQMALYDFMLFDEISTDDKILELNEYVGIEGNTEWRKTE